MGVRRRPLSDDLDGAHAFMAAYHAAGGPAAPIGDDDLRQLVRQRLRSELAYVARTRALGVSLDADDLEYHARQVAVFKQLEPPN